MYAVVDSIGVRGRIERNLQLVSARADLAAGSMVARDVVALVQEAGLGGLAGRDARTRATQASAATHTDLIVHSATAGDVRIAEGAQVRGAKHLRDETVGQVRGRRYMPSPFREPAFYLWQAQRLAAALLAASLVFALAPAAFAVPPRSATGLLKAIGLGFMALVATPIAAVVLALTVTGSPRCRRAPLGACGPGRRCRRAWE